MLFPDSRATSLVLIVSFQLQDEHQYLLVIDIVDDSIALCNMSGVCHAATSNQGLRVTDAGAWIFHYRIKNDKEFFIQCRIGFFSFCDHLCDLWIERYRVH